LDEFEKLAAAAKACLLPQMLEAALRIRFKDKTLKATLAVIGGGGGRVLSLLPSPMINSV